MNLFTLEILYYHVLKYLLFLLKHPVYFCVLSTFTTLMQITVHLMAGLIESHNFVVRILFYKWYISLRRTFLLGVVAKLRKKEY
jgi:hypothetical protein